MSAFFWCFAGILFTLNFQSYCALIFQLVPYHEHRAQLLCLSFLGAKANGRMFTKKKSVSFGSLFASYNDLDKSDI